MAYSRKDAAHRIKVNADGLLEDVLSNKDYLTVIEQARVLSAMLETFIEGIVEGVKEA